MLLDHSVKIVMSSPFLSFSRSEGIKDLVRPLIDILCGKTTTRNIRTYPWIYPKMSKMCNLLLMTKKECYSSNFGDVNANYRFDGGYNFLIL